MADQRAFRVAGRAGRVDDEGWILRRQRCGSFLEPTELRSVNAIQEVAQATKLRVGVAEHGRIIDDDDGLQIGKSVGNGQDLVDVFLILGDENFSATIAHLVLDLGRGRRRVNTVGDCAERLDGEIAKQPFFADVAHNGSPGAAIEPDTLECARMVRHESRVVTPVSLAVDTQMLGTERH